MSEQRGNKAFFEISDLEVSLPQGWFFHDEGPSRFDILPRNEGPQTIEGRSFEIMTNHLSRYYLNVKGMNQRAAHETATRTALYNYGYAQKMANLNEFESGVCLKIGPFNFGNGDETHLHLLYIDYGREDVNIRIRAHEEQHAISWIPEAIEELETKILEERGRSFDFNRIANKELAADCNAVHALVRRGFDLAEIYNYDLKKDPSVAKRFKRASYIYQSEDYSSWGFQMDQFHSWMERRRNRK